ncbi:MAG: pantetheine-phosphate adenylyltransferase [Bacillota bacterium]|nr:pantetheine-phosphate adenylyltransferase [Bacillota bacterium]
MKIFVYPGSFDPVTNGHLDIINRAARLCDQLIVGVLVNISKKTMFSVDERVELIKKAACGIGNVQVESFSGLLVDWVRIKNADAIIKGLRAVQDFEYELQMADLNKILDPQVETLFMMSSANYSCISSSAVKEIAGMGGSIKEFVPESIINEIMLKCNSK